MKKLIIMRGIPGSGKSYIAKQLVPADKIYSTDDFWGPNYNFDITKLFQAHMWNQRRVETAMNSGYELIAVDNTNVTWKEIKPYYELAKKYGYEVEYKEPTSPWWNETVNAIRSNDLIKLNECVDILFTKNTHNVPRTTIEKMVNRWQLTESLNTL